jgi:hypothetical protein
LNDWILPLRQPLWCFFLHSFLREKRGKDLEGIAEELYLCCPAEKSKKSSFLPGYDVKQKGGSDWLLKSSESEKKIWQE